MDKDEETMPLPPHAPGSAGRAPRRPHIGEHLVHLDVNGFHYPPYAQAFDIAKGQSALFNAYSVVRAVPRDGL